MSPVAAEGGAGQIVCVAPLCLRSRNSYFIVDLYCSRCVGPATQEVAWSNKPFGRFWRPGGERTGLFVRRELAAVVRSNFSFVPYIIYHQRVDTHQHSRVHLRFYAAFSGCVLMSGTLAVGAALVLRHACPMTCLLYYF